MEPFKPLIITLLFTVTYGRNNNVLNILCSSGKCFENGCVTTTFPALIMIITIFGFPMFGLAGRCFFKKIFLNLEHTEITWASKVSV